MLLPLCTKCMPALVWLHRAQEHFFFLFASVVLINCAHCRLRKLLFSTYQRRFICLSALSAFSPPLLSSVFALYCCVFQCTGRHSGRSRLDCYSDRQRACFLFVWHEQHTSLWQACSRQKVHQTHKHSQFFFFFLVIVGLWSGWQFSCMKCKR